MLHQFRMVTGLKRKEIIRTVGRLCLHPRDLLYFYLYDGRWPTMSEASFIADVGLDVFQIFYSRDIVIQ